VTGSPPGTSETAIDFELQNFTLHPEYMIELSYKMLSLFLGKRNAAIVILHLPQTDKNQEDRKEARQYLASNFGTKSVLKLILARMD